MEVELKLQSLSFPSYFAFVPTAEDMKLSPRAFHRKMCSGREVAGHDGFYVMVQYSVSCATSYKNWNLGARPILRAGWANIQYYIFRSVHDALVPMVLVLVSLFLRCVWRL